MYFVCSDLLFVLFGYVLELLLDINVYKILFIDVYCYKVI